MKFKTVLMLVLILIISMMSMGCGCYYIEAGYVGVKVYLYGTDKGVSSSKLPVGKGWAGWNEEIYKFPTFLKVYPFTQDKTEGSPIDEAFYFQSNEGVKCNVDIAVQARTNPELVDIMFQTYREDTLEAIIKKFIKNDIRDGIVNNLSSLKVEDLYGTKKMDAMRVVEKYVRDKLVPKGIVIEQITMISDIRFPEDIQKSIIAKITATQEAMQRENEVQKARADAEITITKAQAEAKALALKTMSITPSLVEYEKVQASLKAIEKWNGILPEYMMSGGTVPFINLNTGK